MRLFDCVPGDWAGVDSSNASLERVTWSDLKTELADRLVDLRRHYFTARLQGAKQAEDLRQQAMELETALLDLESARHKASLETGK